MLPAKRDEFYERKKPAKGNIMSKINLISHLTETGHITSFRHS